MAAAGVLLAGCSSPQNAEPALFPLNEGWRWTYQVTTDEAGKVTQREYVVQNRGQTTELKKRASRERRNSDGNRFYVSSDESGIYRVGVRVEIEDEPREDEDTLRRFVIKAPFEAGTSWQIMTWPFLLRRTLGWPEEMKYGKPILMTYRIESADATVTVPAGKFDRCLLVTGIHTARLYIDPVAGFKDVPFTQKEWYCPQVGMVKLVRNEEIKSAAFKGGSMTFELTKLSK